MKVAMPGGDKNPQIRLTSDQYPDIANWEVGKTYMVELELKAKAKAEGQEYAFDTANKGLVRMTFDVISVKEDSPAEDASENKK